MYSKYKKFIEKYISHNFIEWNLFKSKLGVKNYKKGQTIHHIGTVIQNQIPFKENKSKAPQANNLRTCVLFEILLIFSKLIAKLLTTL